MNELLQWLPAIIALVSAVVTIVVVRERAAATAQALADHRAESRESAAATTAKLDALIAADSRAENRLTEHAGRIAEHERLYQHVRDTLEDHEQRLRELEREPRARGYTGGSSR